MRWGHFDLGDKAKNIVHVDREDNGIMCTIEWYPRKDGFQPEQS